MRSIIRVAMPESAQCDCMGKTSSSGDAWRGAVARSSAVDARSHNGASIAEDGGSCRMQLQGLERYARIWVAVEDARRAGRQDAVRFVAGRVGVTVARVKQMEQQAQQRLETLDAARALAESTATTPGPRLYEIVIGPVRRSRWFSDDGRALVVAMRWGRAFFGQLVAECPADSVDGAVLRDHPRCQVLRHRPSTLPRLARREVDLVASWEVASLFVGCGPAHGATRADPFATEPEHQGDKP
jgi:hypothetical protein